MQFESKARYLRFSPYKLRPYVDVIRGKNVENALNWLQTCPVKRVVPIKKVLEAASASAKQLKGLHTEQLVIKDIRVDEGPIYKYFRPGAMGRANIQRRRFSHMRVIVENIAKSKD